MCISDSRSPEGDEGIGEAPAAAEPDFWPGLLAAVRGKVPSAYPFLSNPAMVQGRLEHGTVTLWADSEFTRNMVGTPGVLDALAKAASAMLGGEIRCAAKVGEAPQAPQASRAPQAAAPGPEREHDNLDDLLALGQQLDGIVQINE